MWEGGREREEGRDGGREEKNRLTDVAVVACMFVANVLCRCRGVACNTNINSCVDDSLV